MEKKFFDVFPNLQVNPDVKGWLDEAAVTRVTCNSERTRLRIYLVCDRWIHKKYIFQVEEEIRRQFFGQISIQVKIIERFLLSKQYTPENFMEVYKPSMLAELKAYNQLEHNLFLGAQMEFPQAHSLRLLIPDSMIARERGEVLVEYLEKVFCERCGMDLKVESQFVAHKESKYRKNAERKLEQEVEQVLQHASLGSEEVKEKSAPKPGPAPSGKSGKNAPQPPKRSGNLDLVYGRDFEGESLPLEAIAGEMGEVIVRGQVISLDEREIRNEKTILIFAITDFTDSIVVKMFLENSQVSEMKESIHKGAFLKIKGVTAIDRFDGELTIGSVRGIKKIGDFTAKRMDTSPEKRVELHCHTKMSDMDGVTDAKDLVKRAYEWGHRAIAITDHGVVQAFPEAHHCFDAWGGCVPPEADFKVIYGMEAYLVDDTKGMVQNDKGQKLTDNFVVFDLETTGFSPIANRIIEIGAVRVEGGKIVDRFSTFVNPQTPIPYRIEQLTGINDSMVMDAPEIGEVLPEFLKFCQGAALVAHNASFDVGFVERNCQQLGLSFDFTSVDTVGMARFLLPSLNRFKLDTVAKALQIPLYNHHRAVDDAGCTAEIFVKFV
ncbi:MAG: PHP domain-containing protein, partial [Lachnospiraceae bacterium]|nr:PHP domain-containing protein [Lachnospiraceae bacterium]